MARAEEGPLSNTTTISANWMTDEGAIALARRLEAYWRDKGSTEVKVWTEAVNHTKGSYLIVRSNLVNGMPPDFRRIQARERAEMNELRIVT